MLNNKELARFMSKLECADYGRDDGPCWEWQASKYTSGYGKVRVRRIKQGYMGAHRVAMAHFRAFDIFSSMFICHHCDNPACCNPDHLFVGTRIDNVRDMIMKGRNHRLQNNKGENAQGAKLTDDNVREIMKLLPELSNKQISEKYGVTHSSISSIRRAKTWTHVTGFNPDTFVKHQYC